MIIRVVFTECKEKIQAIRFLRAITGLGLRECKDLVDKFDTTIGTRVAPCMTGEYRFRVDAKKALTGLLPQFNEGGKSYPAGLNMYPEEIDIIDCTPQL